MPTQDIPRDWFPATTVMSAASQAFTAVVKQYAAQHAGRVTHWAIP